MKYQVCTASPLNTEIGLRFYGGDLLIATNVAKKLGKLKNIAVGFYFPSLELSYLRHIVQSGPRFLYFSEKGRPLRQSHVYIWKSPSDKHQTKQ